MAGLMAPGSPFQCCCCCGASACCTFALTDGFELTWDFCSDRITPSGISAGELIFATASLVGFNSLFGIDGSAAGATNPPWQPSGTILTCPVGQLTASTKEAAVGLGLATVFDETFGSWWVLAEVSYDTQVMVSGDLDATDGVNLTVDGTGHVILSNGDLSMITTATVALPDETRLVLIGFNLAGDLWVCGDIYAGAWSGVTEFQPIFVNLLTDTPMLYWTGWATDADVTAVGNSAQVQAFLTDYPLIWHD